MTELSTAIDRSEEFRLHPLGFFYLKFQFTCDESHRFHVWLQCAQESSINDRHQHSFDIDSKILTGCIRNELFRFKETPDGTDHEFAVSYESDRSILSPTGKSGKLVLFSAFDSTAGGSFFLSAGVIHRVTATERPCITMLTTSEREIPIFSYGTHEKEPHFVRRLVDDNEAQQIKELLELIVI